MKVKITGFWDNDFALYERFKGYTLGNSSWKGMELVTDDKYDMLVILTRPHHDCKEYDSKKAITLLTEPPATATLIPHETSEVMSMYLPLPFFDSFHKNDWDLLQQPKIAKSELLSSVTSELNYLEGHKARRQLIAFLDQRIAEGFDLWGKKYTNDFLVNLKSYRGELKNKYDALWKYQYHFACENSFIQNYFTEKIVDPIIAECLCFYDGCENIEDFIDERAFVKIDIFNPLLSIEKMIDVIDANEWNKRIKYIRQQKKRLLNDLNPLNIMWLAVNGKDVLRECRL